MSLKILIPQTEDAIEIAPGGLIAAGTSAVPIQDPNVGAGVIELFVDPTTTDGARYNTVRVESLLEPTDTFATQGSGLYTIRGLAGVKTGKTFAGSANQGYLAGVQGKLQIAGTLGNGNSGGIYSAAVLAQINAAGAAFGADAEVYGLWIDNQAGGANLPTLSHLLNITNNGGSVTNVMKVYGNGGKIAQFLDVESCVSGANGCVISASSAGSLAKALRIKIDGVQHYIPCYTGTT